MPRDKEINRIRILQAAKEEFLEKGFEKASIRTIGSRAGVMGQNMLTLYMTL